MVSNIFSLIFISFCVWFSFVFGNENVTTETINSKNSTWKAGIDSVIPDIPLSKLQHLGRVLPPKQREDWSRKTYVDHRSNVAIPETFDAREKWPKCAAIINNIRDQGDCGACWAFSAAGVMSDRLCIHSNGNIQVNISAQDILTCCAECGSCGGGSPISAFEFWKKRGVVTGGEFRSKNGCKSYTFDTCTHVSGYCGEESKLSSKVQCIEVMSPDETPMCSETCDESSNLTFSKQLTKGSKAYFIMGEEDMKTEILKNGPIVATFTVFQDFLCYKSGVYQNIGGGVVYGHAVRVIGWGVENGAAYWLIANSWDKDWGDNGFFKILRGEDECGIEGYALAALPSKKQTLQK